MTMRTKIIIAAVVTGIAVLLFVGTLFLFKGDTTNEPNSQNVTFPTATSTGSEVPGSATLGGEGGIVVNDFIRNGITVEDPANEGSYYLAGETGYCNDDGSCVSAGVDDVGFNIVYFAEDDSFVIALKREPLGEVRGDAERYLRETLGVNQQTLCSLRVYVGTTLYVSEIYGGMGNLGISTCPNAKALPI